ncbi:MAG: AraC family transcriptional regulator, partial [Bacteroidota bacterium]
GQLKIGIRLKPLAAEYYLDTYLKAGNEVINRFAEFAKPLSGELAADLKSFAARASDDMNQVLKTRTLDERKLKLFGLLEETSGAIPVETLAQQCYWSTRQINRYFNKQFGISLKGYCNILRCYASYGKIKAGHLYPDFDYYDQSHFIREIKKHTGTTPKALLKNEYQRYLQFNDRNSLR